MLEGAKLSVNARNLGDKRYIASCAWDTCYFGDRRTRPRDVQLSLVSSAATSRRATTMGRDVMELSRMCQTACETDLARHCFNIVAMSLELRHGVSISKSFATDVEN